MRNLVTPLLMIVAPGTAWAGEEVSPKRAFELIKADQNKARDEYRSFLQSDAVNDESKLTFRIDQFLERSHRNCEEALKIAQECRGDPLAYQALKFVVDTARGGPSDYSAQAFKEIRLHHAQHDDVGEFCLQRFWISDFSATEDLIRYVVRSHPEAKQRGYATFALAQLLIRRCEQKRRFETLKQLGLHKDAECSEVALATNLGSADEEIRKLLTHVGTNYHDLAYDKDQTLGQIASAKLSGYIRLRVGQQMPSISGWDSEGAQFSTEDYAGRTRLLLFTGNWCGPCKAMYPFLRQLQESYSERGLAILAVSTDETLDTLRKDRESNVITWRCWWDGGFGEIVKSLGIQSYPTVLLVDQRGVLRFKNLRGGSLENAVRYLLTESNESGKDRHR